MSLNNAQSLAASIARGGRGLIAVGSWKGKTPEKPVELYESEACPYCRKVRDVLTELDLEYVSHPCAKGSKNRAYVAERGGKEMFPYLVDPNTGVAMHESEDIINYLFETYGTRRPLVAKLAAPLDLVSSTLASAIRYRARKVDHRRSASPEETLVLYNFEASPYCRKVREALNELDLSAHIKNVGKTSDRRPELVELGGRMMVPYLMDPNTDVAMYESDDIVAYLHETYGKD